MSSYHLGFPTETIVVFLIIVIGAMFIDLFMHRYDKPISLKSATIWSLFWVIIAMLFDIFLYLHHGVEIASLFLTGYVLEKVLSIDNLFVITAIFSWFDVPNRYRYRVLCFGMLGIVIFRGVFIAIGTNLLRLGPYIEVVFALIVSWTVVIMLRRKKKNNNIENYSNYLIYRIINSFYPIWPKISSNKFILTQEEIDVELKKPENQNLTVIWQVKKAKYYATPLFLCTVVVEFSDFMFAFDSMPAIIAVSCEQLIIYSAVMFAILGLRMFYFILETLKWYLIYLEKAFILLLFFVPFKLFLNVTDHFWHHGYNISAIISLLIILSVLILGIIASLLFSCQKKTT